MNAKLGFLLCVLVVSLAVLLGGCANGNGTKSAPPGTHLVELYNGGKIVGQWYSTDVPVRKTWSSDSWHFTDVETERVVRISGTIIITAL